MIDTVLAAKRMRINELKMIGGSGASHIASVLSVTDILAVLYGRVLRVSPTTMDVPHDVFILSKGHAGAAVYAALAEYGFLPEETLSTYYQNGSVLSGHVSHKGVKGVECSTGSLGHGIGIAAGMALAQKADGEPYRTFTLVGDGECNEGSVWEAAAFAAHHKLDNFTVIVDENGMQALGKTKDILDMSPMIKKWEAFGFYAVEVDGHDHEALYKALSHREVSRPTAVLCRTVKGKGVSFMEADSLLWHYRDPKGELLEQAIREVEEK